MKVLIVEDDRYLQDMLREFLEQRGHEVVSVDTAEAAWDVCQLETFPLLMIDWVLPGESGVDLCRRLRNEERFEFSLLIMVTLRNDPASLSQALEAGVDDFLTKPIDWETLEIRMGIAEQRVRVLQNSSEVVAALAQSTKKEEQLLERTARLTSVGVLAAGVAHEINNPLQGMLSHVSAIRRSSDPDLRMKESLDMVDRGIRTISGLVKRLLVLGGEHDGSLGIATCGEAVDFVATLLRGQLQRANIKLVVNHEDPTLSVAISQRNLIQILLNLILNSVDAMPDGGAIEIRSKASDHAGVVTVADSGKGISAECIKDIFVPFFTTKAAQGTGLGLSMSEAMVRKAGGRIEVKSVEGEGATFLVYLPLE